MSAWTIDEWPLREQPDSLLAGLDAVRGQLHAEAATGDALPRLAGEIASHTARQIPVERLRTLLGAPQDRARAARC